MFAWPEAAPLKPALRKQSIGAPHRRRRPVEENSLFRAGRVPVARIAARERLTAKARPPLMAPQRLEKTEFAPGNGMAPEASTHKIWGQEGAAALAEFHSHPAACSEDGARIASAAICKSPGNGAVKS